VRSLEVEDGLPRALAELGCLSIMKKALLSGNALPLPLLQVEFTIRAEKACSTSRKHRTVSSFDIVALFRGRATFVSHSTHVRRFEGIRLTRVRATGCARGCG
jgi:hypothetical protein